MANPANFPATLKAGVFPSSDSGPFPEFNFNVDRSSRYLPKNHPFGVCISGGGARSFSAAIGQMRALRSLGVLDVTGAISSVSGGTWFNTMYQYISPSISDNQLLGPSIAPKDLTVDRINSIDSKNIGSPLLSLTNGAISAQVAALEVLVKVLKILPQNRVYSRTLNSLLLSPFSLDGISTFFTLDDQSATAAVNANSGLTKSNFYTVRPGRPYFIASATQVFPTGQGSKDILRHFEYTPLYSGTPQLFPDAGPKRQDFGGGYVQSFAFDSTTPTNTSSPVDVPAPRPIFLLSDVMGSSGAAPGALLDEIGLPSLFPMFNYWPAVNLGNEESVLYSFTDGGNLEDVGIVPLLRRQYPVIIAFVNAELPIGSTNGQAFDGISGQVSRLFGFLPPETLGNGQDTQIFPKTKFDDLKAGLEATKNSGAYHVDSYPIHPNNSFGIPAYPQSINNGKVTVLWFYNNLNCDWKSAVTDKGVQGVLNSTDKTNFFGNFPNYSTVFQNDTKVLGADVPELLLLTAEQVNLLGHMTEYTVATSAAPVIDKLLKENT